MKGEPVLEERGQAVLVVWGSRGIQGSSSLGERVTTPLKKQAV